MYVTPSTFTLEFLQRAAAARSLPGYPGLEVEVSYVPPHTDTEIFDRASDVEGPTNFVQATYAGLPPKFRKDGRRYRRRFRELKGYGDTIVVTYLSSYYWLEPVSAVIQFRRACDSAEMLALTCRIFICDEDNRLDLPAYLALPLQEDVEEDAKPLPVPERERQKVYA